VDRQGIGGIFCALPGTVRYGLVPTESSMHHLAGIVKVLEPGIPAAQSGAT
jgi:hypothetical protein